MSENYGRDANLGGFLVYINGVRVPSSSASVSVQSGGYANASISLPAHSILRGLGDEDNLNVAIFYLDTYYYDEPTWCLLFEGRITGQSYSNQPMGESCGFTAESNINVLSNLYFSFLKKKRGSNTATKDYPNQIVVRGKTASSFLTESLSGRPLARPFDFIENVFNICLGVKRDTARSDLRQSAESLEELIATKKAQLNRSYLRRLDRIRERGGSFNGSVPNAEKEQALLSGISRDIISVARAQGGTVDSIDSFQDLLIRAEIAKDIQEKAIQGSQVAITGFFSRYMRLLRFREHWVCSPYLEGIPNSDNPIRAHMGGGVFPFLRSAKAKKFVKSMVRQTGAQYGPGGSALGLIQNLYNMYFYNITEVLAPPAYQVDKYGLPLARFYDSAPDGESINYVEWSSILHRDKRRLCIASYLTNPVSSYSIPPSCNVMFPSMTFSVSINDSYNSKPTRLYYNKRSPYGRLNLSNRSPGYNMDPSRVGYPSVAAGHAQNAAGGAREGLEYLIFPEEYFRGPNPVIDNMHPTYMDLQKYANSARFSAPANRTAPTTLPAGLDPETANRALASAQRMGTNGYSSYALYFLVAQKEYLSRKFGAVSASASTVFNPYMVVGMPCALLSNGETGHQILGEVVSIQHSLTPSSSMTSVSIAKVRHIEETIKNIESDAANLDMSPQEPVSEVRDLLQIYETANEYYSQLFKKDEIGRSPLVNEEIRSQIIEYQSLLEELSDLKSRKAAVDADPSSTDEQKAELAEAVSIKQREVTSRREGLPDSVDRDTLDYYPLLLRPAAFDFKQFLGWNAPEGEDPAFIVMRESDAALAKEKAGTNEYRLEREGYQENSKLVPLPEASRYFTSTDYSMRYCSRPVCTLEQYIDFYATSGRTAANLDPIGRGRGVRLNPKTDSLSGAVYYDVIRQFIGGPGLEPGSSVRDRSRALRASLSNLESELEDTGLYLNQLDELERASAATLQLTTITDQGPNQVFKSFGQNDVAKYTDLADSRKDWQSLLLDYLTIIEGTNPVRGA